MIIVDYYFAFLTVVVICLKRGANDLHVVQLMPLPPIMASFLALLKSRIVYLLPFWCRLNQVVLEKRPLNRCNSSSSSLLLRGCKVLL